MIDRLQGTNENKYHDPKEKNDNKYQDPKEKKC